MNGALGGTGDDDGMTVSWGELLAESVSRLRSAGFESADTDARWIVEEASGLDGADLLSGLDDAATVRGVARLDSMMGRRLAGEPIQYVLGHWPFRSLDLMVDERVLIPRPETEVVCTYALAALDDVMSERVPRGDRGEARVVDLGAGSGALGLAIAGERPGAHVWMVENSPDAAVVTRANAAAQGRASLHVRVVEGSWFEPLPSDLRGTFDLIVSNPPYVATDDELDASVADWEPSVALFAGPSGMDAIELIVNEAPAWLRRGGALVVEIGHTQESAVSSLASSAGFRQVDVLPDLAGLPRALVART